MGGDPRGQIGEQAYDFPRVAAEALYLWPERPRYDGMSYGVGFYGVYPFWGNDVYFVEPRWERPPGPMIHTRPRR